MGCRPSRNSLSRVADSTCEYNRSYMKEFDVARRKQKKSSRENRRRTPTYNNFSSTTKVYDRSSGTSKITVRLSTDGSMLEIEQFDVEYDSAKTAEVTENIDDDQGLIMKSVSESISLRNCGNLYVRCDSAPLLVSSSSASACKDTKESACGLASCCIQNRANSETMSEEYKPKSTSFIDCQNDNDVVVEHSCEVHRDYEPTKKTGDDKSLDSDSLNDSSSHKDHIRNKQTCDDVGTNTIVTREPSSGSDPTSICQKTTILVKRSSLEQQMRGSYEKDCESHKNTCSTFKHVAKNVQQKRYHSNRERSHDNCCYTRTLCQEKYSAVGTSGENSRKPHYTNSMTFGVNVEDLNKTETFLINNHDSRLENQIAENNQLGIICSPCDNDNCNSQICDCCCINCVCGCCQNAPCRCCDAITPDNSNNCYQSELPSTREGEMNFGMSCCCCFTKYSNSGKNDQQFLRVSHFHDADQAPCKPDDSKRLSQNEGRNDIEDELLNGERHSLTDSHSNKAFDNRSLHKVNCSQEPMIYNLNETDSEMTSFTTSLEDGNVFQTSYDYEKSDLSNSKHEGSDSERNKSSTHFLELRRCHELTSQRPCVPNKTVSRELDFYNYSQYLQKSAPVTSDKSDKLYQEHFKIRNGAVCVHNELETLNVDNLKPVVMVTNEVPRTSTKDDGRPCINLKRSGRSDRDECCDHYGEMTDIVDNDIYHDTCCCGKQSHIIESEDNLLIKHCKDIDDQPMNDSDMWNHNIQGKQNSKIFPFCEYESFVIKDNRKDYLNENCASSEISIDCNKPLITENDEETSTSEGSDSSVDDDGDFYDDSCDECRDEYVDALETTYV